MHATSTVTSHTPSCPHARLSSSLHTAQLAEVLQALDIPHDLARPLPSHTLPGWGIESIADDSLTLYASDPGWRIMGVAGRVEDRATIFAAMRQMHRLNCAIWSLWFWFERDTLCVATVHEDHILHTEIDRQRPRTLDLERFAALARHDDTRDDTAWRRQICDALDQSRLTHRFYEDFVRARKRLAHAVKNAPGSQQDRDALALTVLLRVIVLYFLQGRGALDADRWFLRHRLDTARAADAPFWETVLRPLFFGALSRPVHDRSAAARALGAIPFLNGGLFEPSAFERDHPGITWPEAIWSQIFDDFFERYSFVLRDPVPQVHATHIDPEMLGRVFEGLMCQDHRSQTGAFYTPAPLVARMVAQSMSGYLARKLSLPEDDLHALVTTGSLPASLATNPVHLQALAHALSDLKILDPAVGTGAFLIEALGALRRCWSGLRAAGYMGGAHPHTYAGVRALIHDHLHGVDVNTTAVRLCELRMWLALLSMWPRDLCEAIPTMEPLPNLGHRLAVGDSLIGPHEHVMLDVRGKRRAAWRGWRPEDLASAQVTRGCDELSRLQDRYLGSHGADKIQAQRELERVEREQVVSLLDARRARHEHDIRALEQLAHTPDLFGDTHELPERAREQLLMLYREREAFTRRIDLARRGDRALTFCYEARFGEVMARGGFDLILTNPPWVRATAQERQIKGLHGVRYRSAAGGLWRGATQQGVRATFGTQPDLSALFIERSLELLRPQGRLCALVPAKLFRSLHGAAVRGVMAEHHIIALEDLSEARGQFFDAVTYPAVIDIEKRVTSKRARLARRGTPSCPQSDTRITCWRGASSHHTRRPLAALCLHGQDMREPWVISAGAMARVHTLVHQPREGVSVLGSFESLRPRRGVMTGHNASFCMTRARALALCDDNEDLLAQWTRPYVRGRDVRAWQLAAHTDAQRLLWPYCGDHPVDFDVMPGSLQAHFLRHESSLRARSDCRAGITEFWRLFRVQRDIEAPKVIWRDLALWAEAACDEGGHIPMNTAYYIPCEDVVRAWLLTAWMNAWVTRIALHTLAERAQHGYRRHFAWTVASMKIPTRWARFIAGADDPELAADCAFWRSRHDGPRLCEAALCDLMGIPHELMLEACGELVRRAKKSA